MATNLRFKYDREADILHIDKCPSYAERESEKLKDEVVARLNPDTGEGSVPLLPSTCLVPLRRPLSGCHRQSRGALSAAPRHAYEHPKIRK